MTQKKVGLFWNKNEYRNSFLFQKRPIFFSFKIPKNRNYEVSRRQKNFFSRWNNFLHRARQMYRKKYFF